MTGSETSVTIVEEDHPAMVALTALVGSGSISPETYNNLVFKFKKLHHAFGQSCATEQILLRRTRDLNRELKTQKATIQESATQQQDHRSALTSLRQHVTNIQTELDQIHSQIESTKINGALKRKERDKLADKVAKARDDQFMKLEPLRRQMQMEVTALEEAIAQRRQSIESLRATARTIANQMTRADTELQALDRRKKQVDFKMLEVSSIPVKTRQKAATVETSHNQMLTDERTMTGQLANARATIDYLQNQAHDFEVEYQHVTIDMEGLLQAIGDLRLRTEDVRQKVAEHTNTRQQYEYESRGVLKMCHEQNRVIAGCDERLELILKDVNKKERDSQKLEDGTARLEIETAASRNRLDGLLKEQAREEERLKVAKRERDRTMEARENAARAITSVESINEELMNDVKIALSEKDRKQRIHDDLTVKDREIAVQMTETAVIRDRKAREMTAMRKKTIDARAFAMERNLDYLELSRKAEQNAETLQDLSHLYEKVKLDRNKYMNHIQISRQLIVEYREKIRILENEVEVLRIEFRNVEEAVRLQKNELAHAFQRRDATRSDLKNAEVKFKDIQTQIDFQSNELRRLNGFLSAIEESIATSQKLYNKSANDCSEIQKLLIDKRDELCIIEEQFSRHEWVMRRGEILIRQREEEHKLLTLQLNDFLRQIENKQRKIPQLRAYDGEISELDRQLARERADVDHMTAKLEAPDLKERQRAYCGKDFTMRELEEKVSMYEQRINGKEQQLWEKQILLREVQEKIAEVTRLSGTDDPKSVQAFEKSGNIRAQTMSLRRKKMAALAESAVYQAKGANLEEERNAVKQELTKATERIETGGVFDNYSAKIVKMHERDATAPEGGYRTHEFDSDDDDEEEKRPGRRHFDAYPTVDGLSRPYGAFPVFQPAHPSGQLRHYRLETLRPIEM